MRKLTIEEVEQVYSGIDGRCCCGCSGTHYKKGEEGFERMAKKALRLINDESNGAEDNDDHVAVVIGKRLYIAYRARRAK